MNPQNYNTQASSGLSRPLAVATDDLDLVRRDLLRTLHLERNVFDQERPHFVAEAVSVKMTLLYHGWLAQGLRKSRAHVKEYLEAQARLHFLSEHFGDAAIEVCEDFHGKLGRDALLADEVVKSIGQCHPNASVR
jgi:hypothetical protein